MKSPIFLFSLPRSGSTLLQRLLMGHSEIASASEPWLMLPLLYSMRTNGSLAEYSHLNSQKGINDMIDCLPNGKSDYYASLRGFTDDIYSKLCGNDETYFLDKTPRYHLIIQEILELYPDAKFIFLVRNPLDVMSSMMKTWANNRFWRMYAVAIDLVDGIGNLSKAIEEMGSRAIKLDYDELVSQPESSVKAVLDYLELPGETSVFENIQSRELKGRLGDSSKLSLHGDVVNVKETITPWKETFNNHFRKRYIRKYINSLDETQLNVLGFSKSEILMQIEALKLAPSLGLRDLLDVLYFKMAKYFNAHLFFTNEFSWARKKYLS